MTKVQATSGGLPDSFKSGVQFDACVTAKPAGTRLASLALAA
jgi:hypothetical protein